MRIKNHPILGEDRDAKLVTIYYDGKPIKAKEGEMVAAALMASGVKVLRKTAIHHKPRGIFCAIGRCTDCAMTINGIPGVRTCVTRVEEGMKVETQDGLGKWGNSR